MAESDAERDVNNTLTYLILSAMILVAGMLGAYGGYRYGYDVGTLQAQLETARQKPAEAPAPRRSRDEGDNKPASSNKKKDFEASVLTAEDLSSVDAVVALSGEALETALYILNSVPGGCVPCSETGKSLGQCMLDMPKLLDRTHCSNIPTLVARAARLAGAGKSTDEIRDAVDLGIWYAIAPGDAPAKGRDDAPITIIEYSDFQCPYCKKALPTLSALADRYGDKLRVVFMNLPLPMHELAGPAAKAALAGHAQGKFWFFHDAIFTAPKLDEAELTRIATESGVDMAQWKQDRGGADVDRRVREDTARAGKLGITSTPTFFVNGYRVKGALPPPAFAKIIDAELGS